MKYAPIFTLPVFRASEQINSFRVDNPTTELLPASVCVTARRTFSNFSYGKRGGVCRVCAKSSVIRAGLSSLGADSVSPRGRDLNAPGDPFYITSGSIPTTGLPWWLYEGAPPCFPSALHLQLSMAGCIGNIPRLVL